MKARFLSVIVPFGLFIGATAGAAPKTASVTPARLMSRELSSEATAALIAGHYGAALAAADVAKVEDPQAAWPRYDRAVALVHLDRLDEAVVEYQAAEVRFGTKDPHGRAIAIYGRAHALAEKGRCLDAGTAFEEYAGAVKTSDPRSANEALAMKAACQQRQVASAPIGDASSVTEARQDVQLAQAVERWAAREENQLVGNPGLYRLVEQVRARAQGIVEHGRRQR